MFNRKLDKSLYNVTMYLKGLSWNNNILTSIKLLVWLILILLIYLNLNTRDICVF